MNEKCSFLQRTLQNHVPFYCVKIIDAHKSKTYKSIRIGMDLKIFLKLFNHIYNEIKRLEYTNLIR